MHYKCICGTVVHLNTTKKIEIKDKICFECWKKSFKGWFLREHNYNWQSSYSGNELFTHDVCTKYESWCKENNVVPIWNG